MSIFNYPPTAYTPEGIKLNMDADTMRKEYARLRKLANSRLKRLGDAGYSEYAIYKNNAGRFRPLAGLSERDIMYSLIEVSRFLNSKTSTVTGIKKSINKSVKTLQMHGYNIQVSEFQVFVEFIQKSRFSSIGRIFDSERAVELFQEMYKKGASVDEILSEFNSYEKEVIRERARRRRIKHDNRR